MSAVDRTLLKLAQDSIAELSKKAGAEAFLPMPGGQPPMDPAAMGGGGAPPMDPAMMGGAGGAPPMDPAMMAAGGGAPPMDPAMMGGDPAAMAGGAAPAPAPAPAADPAAAAGAPAPGGTGLDANTIALLIPIIKNAVTEAMQAHGGDGKGKKEKKASPEDRLAAIEAAMGIPPGGAGAAPAAGGAAPAPAGGEGAAPAAPPADPLASVGAAPAAPPEAPKTASAKEQLLSSIERLRKLAK